MEGRSDPVVRVSQENRKVLISVVGKYGVGLVNPVYLL